MAKAEQRLLQRLRFNHEVGSRGQERGRETMDRIIAAAVDLFGEKGFQGTSTHEIAAAAKVNQGLITYHFKSKRGLWNAAMDMIFGSFRNAIADRIYEFRDVEEDVFFRLMVRQYIGWAAKYPHIVRLMVEEGKHHGDRLRWLVGRHIRPIYRSLSLFLSRAQEHGVIIDAPSVNLYYQLMAGAMVFSLSDEVKWVSGKNVLSKDFVEAQTDMMIAMLSADHAPSRRGRTKSNGTTK